MFPRVPPPGAPSWHWSRPPRWSPRRKKGTPAIRRELLIVPLHFGAICTRPCPAGPNAPGPGSDNLAGAVYRPLPRVHVSQQRPLHFYAPEPGPAELLFFPPMYLRNTPRSRESPYSATGSRSPNMERERRPRNAWRSNQPRILAITEHTPVGHRHGRPQPSP